MTKNIFTIFIFSAQVLSAQIIDRRDLYMGIEGFAIAGSQPLTEVQSLTSPLWGVPIPPAIGFTLGFQVSKRGWFETGYRFRESTYKLEMPNYETNVYAGSSHTIPSLYVYKLSNYTTQRVVSRKSYGSYFANFIFGAKYVIDR